MNIERKGGGGVRVVIDLLQRIRELLRYVSRVSLQTKCTCVSYWYNYCVIFYNLGVCGCHCTGNYATTNNV